MFKIYAHIGTAESGYLLPERTRRYTTDRVVTPWGYESEKFNTVAEARAEIDRMGYAHDTSARPGRVTAYVVKAL